MANPNRQSLRGLDPVELSDLEGRSGAEWAAANRSVDGNSQFFLWPSQMQYLGFGPDNIMVDHSAFGGFPGLDYGWMGEFPVDEQPTLPDVPAYLQGPRI